MRVTLLALTLFICHQALTLPAPSAQGSELQAYPISSNDVPHEIATPQELDSRSSSHDKVITDLDTSSLQRRGLLWESQPLDGKMSILLNPTWATGLQVSNAWLTWHFKLNYDPPTNKWQGTIYSNVAESASDLSVCVNKYTQSGTGNTGSTQWSEGQLDIEATWRNPLLSKTVQVSWSAQARFYQQTTSGTPMSSCIIDTLGSAVGYAVDSTANWLCTSPQAGSPVLPILQTVFESFTRGHS
jgi:hypothetical protein